MSPLTPGQIWARNLTALAFLALLIGAAYLFYAKSVDAVVQTRAPDRR